MKNKMKLGMYMIMLLLATSFVSAFIPVATTTETGQQRTTGCVPPIGYSVSYNCHLEYYSIHSVNTYRCGQAIIVSDCDGNVIKETSTQPSPTMKGAEYVMIGLVVLMIILGLIVGFNRMRTMKDDEEELGNNSHY